MPAQLFAINDHSADGAGPIGPCRDGQLSLIGVARNLSRGQQVFGEGDDADLVYKVISGAVSNVRSLADGRRQITAFHLPGDVFGIELGAERRAAAEAICDTVVTSARRASVTEDRDQRDRLWRHALHELERSQDHVLALGRRTAIERVAAFLIDLADRVGAHDAVALPMSRQDIADYLGLTIETVSRTLTQMQARGLVRVECRQVRLLRPAVLAGLCE